MISRWKDPEGVFQIRRAVVPARKRQGYTENFKTERILDDFSLFRVKAYVDRLNHEQQKSAKVTLKILKRKEFWMIFRCSG